METSGKLKYVLSYIVFLFINFGGLALGGIWTNVGTSSEWYANLNIAPWTPPGWVFGAAWTTIGLTFSALMAYAWVKKNVELLILFFPSLILNILWNPVFFGIHQLWLAGGIITILSLLIYFIVDISRKQWGWKIASLGLPYFVWLMIATSLNLFSAIMN